MILRSDDLDAMDKLVRVQLATTLPGPKPICLVGTSNSAGQTNLAPFSSITHLGSIPILIGMVTRPDTVDRHTLSNILQTESWTLNHVHSDILEAAHQCSAKYPRERSEFSATGLTEHFEDGTHAPFVAESHIKLSLTLEDCVDIKANNTKLIIGRVQTIHLPDGVLAEDGSVDISKSLASTALDTYYSLADPVRHAYARP